MLLITIYVRVGRRDVTTPQDFPQILDPKIPVTIGTDYWTLQGPYLVRVINTPRKSLFLQTKTESLGPQQLKPLRIHELYDLDDQNRIVSAEAIRDNWIGRGSRGKAFASRDRTTSWIGRVLFQQQKGHLASSSSNTEGELANHSNKLSSSVLPLSCRSSLPASVKTLFPVSRPDPGAIGSLSSLTDLYEHGHPVSPEPVEESDQRPGCLAVPCSRSRDVPREQCDALPSMAQAASALSSRVGVRSSTNNGCAGGRCLAPTVPDGRIVYGDASDSLRPALAFGSIGKTGPGHLGLRLLPGHPYACVAQARRGRVRLCRPRCGTVRRGPHPVAESNAPPAIPVQTGSDADRHCYSRVYMADRVGNFGWPCGRRAWTRRSYEGLREAGRQQARQVLEPCRRHAMSGRPSSPERPAPGHGYNNDRRTLEQSWICTTTATAGTGSRAGGGGGGAIKFNQASISTSCQGGRDISANGHICEYFSCGNGDSSGTSENTEAEGKSASNSWTTEQCWTAINLDPTTDNCRTGGHCEGVSPIANVRRRDGRSAPSSSVETCEHESQQSIRSLLGSISVVVKVEGIFAEQTERSTLRWNSRGKSRGTCRARGES